MSVPARFPSSCRQPCAESLAQSVSQSSWTRDSLPDLMRRPLCLSLFALSLGWIDRLRLGEAERGREKLSASLSLSVSLSEEEGESTTIGRAAAAARWLRRTDIPSVSASLLSLCLLALSLSLPLPVSLCHAVSSRELAAAPHCNCCVTPPPPCRWFQRSFMRRATAPEHRRLSACLNRGPRSQKCESRRGRRPSNSCAQLVSQRTVRGQAEGCDSAGAGGVPRRLRRIEEGRAVEVPYAPRAAPLIALQPLPAGREPRTPSPGHSDATL